jgi:hypothetical protein
MCCIDQLNSHGKRDSQNQLYRATATTAYGTGCVKVELLVGGG